MVPRPGQEADDYRTAAPRDYLARSQSVRTLPRAPVLKWKANLRILAITKVKTVPYLPISQPFVERLIGTIRREYLDLASFRDAGNLKRKLLCFQEFYNDQRSHCALAGITPSTKIGRCDRRLQIQVPIDGVVTAEAYTICLSPLN